MNEQQIDNLIRYMHTIEISPEEAKLQSTEAAAQELRRLGEEGGGEQEVSYAAALFNTNCARCHTFGWSYDEAGPPGSGAMGPPLFNAERQFPAIEDHIDFVSVGREVGEQIGQQNQASGRMPFFSRVLSPQQIRLIVEYERRLSDPALEPRTGSEDTEQ